MDVQSPELPGRLSLRLDVYSPPKVLQIDGRLCHLVLAFLVVGDFTNSRAPSLHGRYLVSRHPAIQTTGLLTLAPAGLSPAEHASLRWTHNRTCGSPASGSRTRPHAFVHDTSCPSLLKRTSPKCP